MGNCGRKNLANDKDHQKGYSGIESESPKDIRHDKTSKKDEEKDNDGLAINTEIDDIHRDVINIEDLKDELEEYDDYYHIEENDYDEFSDWEIIEFECEMIDDENNRNIAVDGLIGFSECNNKEESTQTSVNSQSVDANTNCHEFQTTRKPLPESKGQTLYTIYEDEDFHLHGLNETQFYADYHGLSRRSDTRSLRSYMSDLSTGSTAALATTPRKNITTCNFCTMYIIHL